ncbi:dermonecrotic toxin domain-containing protein [Pseudomonas arsenicoxydans]|uniref:Dermonecrotic toxin N-terminal domain-containing protein n=1 Tax=Pseudomonas arsenicoxydans TaxID=702115 RepID=A0A502I1D2_9PSED|nr:DUF6543 domain-containing protein [Pseudomonas arsenicoxydans]TPG80797.1 hypothetical protein EAH78_06245 [Pseudomonas arsenicoxydans]
MNVMNKYLPVDNGNRPQWLERASSREQLDYGELEQQLIASQAELDKQLGAYVSLRTFAKNFASQLLQLEFGITLDPDSLMTTRRYLFDVAGRRVTQEDKRCLTDLLLCGLHDEGGRGWVTFVGEHLPSELNQQWLEKVLTDDVRAAYGVEIRALYQRSEVLAAMTRFSRDELLLSALGAKLRRHLDDSDFQRVQRAVNGDANLMIAPLQLRDDTRPLLGLVAVGSRTPGNEDWLLYAPDSPGGQDWYPLPSLRRLSLDIGAWTATPQGRDYLLWRSHALDREAISGYLKQVFKLPGLWRGVELAPTPYTGTEVLNPLVYNHRAWLVAQEESHTPYGYRTATDQQRQTFTRINCELRALKTIEVREGGFVSYERFCHQLIKQRIEAYLLTFGEPVEINPDHIHVEITPEEKMTLTQLIVREVVFYADNEKSKYPRFTVKAGHPSISNLHINDLALHTRVLRPGEKYIDMLRAHYIDRSKGYFRQQLYMGILQRQMRVSILQALFKGRVSKEHFEELMKVVEAFDHPQASSPVGEAPDRVGHSALFKLHLRGRLVVGAFVFRLHVAGKIVEYLYTPQAPDGRELRPFEDFVAAVKTRGLGDYFYERVFGKYQSQVGTYLTDLEQLANFTEAPTLERNSRITDLYWCYYDVLTKVISDVDEKTQSLEEIITGLVYNAVVSAVSVIAIVYAPVGIALSVALLTQNLVQGVHAFTEGNRSKALSHFKDAVIELAVLGKAGLGKSGATAVQKTLIGLLGDVYTVEKLFADVTGQPRLHERALEVIQDILDDPESITSKTTLS